MHGFVTLFNSTVIVPSVRRGDLIESLSVRHVNQEAISYRYGGLDSLADQFCIEGHRCRAHDSGKRSCRRRR